MRFFERGPKPPPPARGIKIKSVGTTWWGKLWIDSLEKLNPEYASRLARGKTYARAGRVHDLVVARGEVRARVMGTMRYDVVITLPPLADETWRAVIEALRAKARFAAELLAGDMPRDVDDAFRAAGASLFPTREGDLTTKCSCPDWANPCKHVAATHYVLGDAFDRDPFLLFELRGRTRSEVVVRKRTFEKREDEGVTLTRVEDEWREPPPALRLSFETPTKHATVLASLGLPASWRERVSLSELVAPLMQSASMRAREIALSEENSTSGGESADKPH